jgi:dihydroneopterin aldolase/2-amino-4-hydroxy-6-hydroxymethyldihydropteridine diphosphokinase
MDKIKINNLEVFCNHGVFKEENVLGQKFLVSAILYVDTREAGLNDDLHKSIHYGEICQYIDQFMKQNTYKLIEAVAENLAMNLLLNRDNLLQIDLEIKKPWAPIGLPIDTVAVEISRKRHTAYIALGSNIGDTKKYLDDAIVQLNENQSCRVNKVSDYITTAPYGNVKQDDFLNACLELQTLLTPNELLNFLHEIEYKANRERIIKWGPRTLDLDIIMYDDLIMSEPDLILPHIEMHKRDFVLEPLAQIAPYKRNPINHKMVIEMLEELKK